MVQHRAETGQVISGKGIAHGGVRSVQCSHHAHVELTHLQARSQHCIHLLGTHGAVERHLLLQVSMQLLNICTYALRVRKVRRHPHQPIHMKLLQPGEGGVGFLVHKLLQYSHLELEHSHIQLVLDMQKAWGVPLSMYKCMAATSLHNPQAHQALHVQPCVLRVHCASVASVHANHNKHTILC